MFAINDPQGEEILLKLKKEIKNDRDLYEKVFYCFKLRELKHSFLSLDLILSMKLVIFLESKTSTLHPWPNYFYY